MREWSFARVFIVTIKLQVSQKRQHKYTDIAGMNEYARKRGD